MSLLGRLLGKPDPGQTEVRALWHRAVEIAREPDWYVQGGIADTVSGRFDAITLVVALIMLRMDASPALRGPSARLTELFVSDMDGQLRQSGVGDLVVGKQVGKLMGALGGRIEALRAALVDRDDQGLIAAIERNVSFGDNPDSAAIARALRVLAAQLASLDEAALLAGRIDR
ncbi:MAG: ubiquinol-cytochrome C chaperone family protein [Sphingomonadales bacterium]|nr:ubiquinol-cytochrome C chaperone family protein [Sphingomonadales bacterium]